MVNANVSGNKKMLWIIIAAAVVLLAAIIIGIILLLPSGDVNLSVDPQKVTLEVGQTQQLQLVSEDGKRQNLGAQWSSSAASVATVDKNGLVTAVAAGDAKITAAVKVKGKEYIATAQVTVQASGGDKVVIGGDETPDVSLIEGEVFTVSSATAGIIPDMDAGTIEIQDVVSQTELFFAASAAEPYADAWEIRGSIAKEDITKTLFLSFGVKNAEGKDQWFCIYEDHMSRQRYYNWADTAYTIDNKYVGFNQTSTSFFWREAGNGGDKLDFILVLKDDVLKLYFGNEKNEMSLAWSLPLTNELFGGFDADTAYQVGINTVDPCNAMITDISVKNGEDVVDLGGLVGGDTADVRIPGNRFAISSATMGVSYNGNQGTITIKETAKETETFFAAGKGQKYSNAWEMSGTITKEDISKSVFLSFGVKDSKGNSQWFCIFEDCMARQRYSNWADTKYACDGQRVIFNQAACSFFWREANQGGQKLNYKLILHDDVLQLYFGNDKHDMALAWYLPLTEKLFGGFAAGSTYQIGINTVDAIKLNFTNVTVKTGANAAAVPEYVEGGKFVLLNKSSNIDDDPLNGTISISNSESQSEMIFAASPYALTDKAWELSGTIKKDDPTANMFLSFGVKDSSGKDQWFCILEDCMARQRYWNWWDTKYLCDDEFVFFNQASTSFYWRETGADHLNFKIVVKNDVLKAYFGNSSNDMELAWILPLTNELFGGFTAGSKYMLGITTVDPNNASITNISVKTGDAVVDEDLPGEEDTTGYQFFVDSKTGGVKPAPAEGLITVSGSVSESETMFAANAEQTYAKQWELSGTVTKADITNNLFISFGVRDHNAKTQWFCIYEDGLSRQRYWNWADSKYPFDSEYVHFNQAACDFFWKNNNQDHLSFKLVLKNDVLEAYFGSSADDLALAWSLPLTETVFGGFNADSAYQLGITTVDPCTLTFSDVSVVTADAIAGGAEYNKLYDTSRYVSEMYTQINKWNSQAKEDVTTIFIGDSFFHEEGFFKTFSSIYGNQEALCLGIGGTTTYHWVSMLNDWLEGTNPKNIVVNIGTNNMGLTPPNGHNDNVIAGLQELFTEIKEKFPESNIYWFSIAPRSDMNREDDKQIINAAMKQWCAENGVTYIESPIQDPATDCCDGLHPTDASYVKYTEALAAAGCEILDIDRSNDKFFIAGKTSNVLTDPVNGVITTTGSGDTETFFAADANGGFAKSWQIAGTIEKENINNNLFLSFGIKNASGKDQWFCIYEDAMSRQRYWNWADTKYAYDGEYVIYNQASTSFYWKEAAKGGQKLNFKLILQNDVLKAYFGNDMYDMTLAWSLPLTDSTFGGFTAGSEYQIGIATVDPCALTISVDNCATELVKYQIVYASEENKPAAEGVLERLETLNSCFDIWYEIVPDSTDAISNEIIIGNTARNNAEITALLEELPEYDYAIVSKGSTIYIVAHNNVGVYRGLDRMVELVEGNSTGDSLMIPEGVYTCQDNETSDVQALAEGAELRIMSYNILFDTTPHYASRIGRLSNILTYYKPDVVGLNETIQGWHEQLQRALAADGTYQFACAEVSSGAYNMTTFLYNPETVKLIDEYVLDLDAGSDIRVLAVAVFERLSDGRRFVVTNTHPTPTQYSGYSANISTIITLAKGELNKYANLPFIMVGDFNTAESRTEYNQLLTGIGVTDTKYDADELVRNISTYLPDSLGGTVNTDGTAAIDHIFANGMVETKLYNVVVDLDATNISDHLPVYADVAFTEATEEPGTPVEPNGKFYIDSKTDNVTVDAANGKITTNGSGNTETFFAASKDSVRDAEWEISGTITKNNISNNLFLSFGVKDANGKDQWFCIYESGISRQRYWNWADTKYAADGVYVIYNQASTSFYWKEAAKGGQKLNFKLVLKDDVLKAYFGNDMYDMALAWSLPLTDSVFGGFAAGSTYQLGINTVDPCALTITDILVATGDNVSSDEIQEPEELPLDEELQALLSGKYVSILGDSISTYQGVSNVGTTNTTIAGYNVWYNGDWQNVMSSQEQTYWGKVIAKYDMNLLVNNSCGGNRLTNASGTGNSIAAGYIRMEQLAANTGALNGKKPDLILMFMGTNDYIAGLTLGELKDSTYTDVIVGDGYKTPANFTEAYIIALEKAGKLYPNAQVMCFTLIPSHYNPNSVTLNAYNERIREIAAHYDNVTLVDIAAESGITMQNYTSYTFDGTHPNIAGMHRIAIVLENALKKVSFESSAPAENFYIASKTDNVTADAENGIITTDGSGNTETIFAADANGSYSGCWEMSGTIKKADITKGVFLSFGVKDSNGKDQWFCILEDCMARQRYWNWWDTKYACDGEHVIFNQAACSFYWKEAGADDLNFKLVLKDDLLEAYFGSDTQAMTLAWSLPLTESTFGGFTAGSKYQIGINTVDPCALTISNLSVVTNENASSGGEEETPDPVQDLFYIASKTDNVTTDVESGNITTSGSGNTETIFAADENGSYSDYWEMSGTIKKANLSDNLFLSFGVKDANGKDQWFCILEDCMARQRYWNWWDTKYACDGEHVIFNQAACSFYWKETGADHLYYKLVLQNDVLEVYFGNSSNALSLAWKLPLTESTFGGFTAGSKYQIGINTVDPCALTISGISVKTDEEEN